MKSNWRFSGMGWTFSKHSYASTQLDIEEPLRSSILGWAEEHVAEADLAREEDGGLELDPHITIRYGLVPNPGQSLVDAVQEAIGQFANGHARLGRLQYFEAPGRPDVLYAEVDSEHLHYLNGRLATLPHVDTHDVYRPHLTLAYLEKGSGQKYASQPTPFDGAEIAFDRITVSDTEGNKDVLLLHGTPDLTEFSAGPELCSVGDKPDWVKFSGIGVLLDNETPCREGNIEGVPWIEKRARLFVAGSYKVGDKVLTYAEPQLDKMAASVPHRPECDPTWDVPVQLDHSWSARESVGNVRSAERIGQELWGWLRFVGEDEVRKVKSRTWLKLSIQHDALFALMEVSVTPFPRVLSARLYSQSTQSEDDPVSLPNAAAQPQNPPAPGAAPAQAQAPATPTQPATAAVATQAAPAQAAPAQPAPVPAHPTPVPVGATFDAAGWMQAEQARFAAENAQLRAEQAQLRAEQQEMKAAMRFAQVQGLVTGYRNTGQTTPAMADSELALAATFSDEQIVLFKAYKATQTSDGRRPDFNTYGQQSADSPGNAADASEYAEGAAFAAKRNAATPPAAAAAAPVL